MESSVGSNYIAALYKIAALKRKSFKERGVLFFIST